ncbi:hypothetical protein BgiMline_025069, partial [Biomphalaria glabrata]
EDIMPKAKEVSNHPCHLLSLPSAKRFWCRHCMTVFEDAITRWHHSRSCRYGVVNNFMRRRELEAKALQNTSVLNPIEARLEHSIQMSDLATKNVSAATTSRQENVIMPEQDSFTCFICHQKFLSMEEMRMHVKFPCSNSKIITSHVPHPKNSVPVFIDKMPVRQSWQQSIHQQDLLHQTYGHSSIQQSNQEACLDKSDQEIETHHYETSTLTFTRDSNSTETITPTNIYVNELGETVIEVENLDLNTEGAELSLAHLLTQLSQQGIVFDKNRTAELQCKQDIGVSGDSNILYTTDAAYEEVIKEEEEQPTAEDAANTLAQLAGFRSFRNSQPTYEVTAAEDRPVHSMDGYQYSDYIAGQSVTSTQSEMDITYKYEYSSESCEEGNGASQVGALVQCRSSSSLPFHSGRTITQSGDRVSIVEHIYDSALGKYVPVTDSQVMQTDEEVNCSSIASTQCYTIEEKRDSENVKQELIDGHYSEHVTVSERGASKLNTPVLDVSPVILSNESVKNCSAPEEKSQENEEFTVPELSLQEIVDTNNISFEDQLPLGNQQTVKTASQNSTCLESSEGSLPLEYTTESVEQFSSQSNHIGATVFVVSETEVQDIDDRTS